MPMKKIISVLIFGLIINYSIGQAIVEQPAEFPGGLSKFYDYLSKTIKYPKEARKKGISGRVYIEFCINTNGEVDQDSIRAVSREEMIKTVGEARVGDMVADESLVREAKRAILSSPKWIPGSQSDVAVRQKIVLPIMFKR
jgi:periplasmic protein TonB